MNIKYINKKQKNGIAIIIALFAVASLYIWSRQGSSLKLVHLQSNITCSINQFNNILQKPEYKGKSAIYTHDGDIIYSDIVKAENDIMGNISIITENKKYKKPTGVVLKVPLFAITDIRDLVTKQIMSNKKVLLIYIDGLGYYKYMEYLKEGIIPNIAKLGEAQNILTVYPPITDVTFTSMVTGKTPKYTGIHNRQDSRLLVDTIFEELHKNNKAYSLVEGNINILNADINTILNIDENKNESTDDEALKAALNEAAKAPDFLLVHFHSYDDSGHSYGTKASETTNQIKLLDKYAGQLIKAWTGEIIVTSDHGMHNTEKGGSHGIFCYEDLYIPFIYKPY